MWIRLIGEKRAVQSKHNKRGKEISTQRTNITETECHTVAVTARERTKNKKKSEHKKQN